MKKNLLLLLMLVLTPLLQAQETTIEPGQQAKGYLNSKNMNVDYATGIFYYKIPLHEIKAGNLTLPISLDYVARGVKTDDQPGTVGYNWNLNVGGVVTRTVRGGFADEKERKGAARNLENLANNSSSNTYVVNFQAMDGESDIFTAVFNGRSVDFIIRYHKANPGFMEVIPLVPTNVKIECHWYDSMNAIREWVVTDEEGNKYIYSELESSYMTREGSVEMNSVVNEYYNSSWYLSAIVPADHTSIIEYEYYPRCSGAAWYNDSVHQQMIYTRTTVNYFYGEPMVESAYDFSNYKSDFTWELELACQYFQWENDAYYNKILKNGLYRSLNDFYMNASINELLPDRIIQNMKTIGILYNLTYVEEAYVEIINLLDNMIRECEYKPSTSNTRQAIFHLNNAKQIVRTCREEVREVYRKSSYQFGFQKIVTPMIKSIKSDDSMIEFKYNTRGVKRFVLDNIVVYDVDDDLIKSIRLIRNSPQVGVLDEIAFHDKSGERISNVKFDYYGLVNTCVVTNIYGFPVGYHGPITEEFQSKQRFYVHNDMNSMFNSLKTIKVSNDAEIELHYGINNCNLSLSRFEGIGGLVIGAIMIKDKVSRDSNMITYGYYGGKYVLPQLVDNLSIHYEGGFRDMLTFDRLYNPGPDAYVKLGNNGVYYEEVEETFKGKGQVTYHFVVPNVSNPVYNYWEIGNLLGECYYDSEKRLRKVIRYEYDEELALANKKYFTQIKRCEYFVDRSYLEYFYGDDPYFARNMEKRFAPILPENQSYQIVYDYGVYLKRISEYRFDDEQFECEYWDTYRSESPCYTKTEFDYDLSKSHFPVKKTISNSDGTKSIEIVKRALDFDDGTDSCIPLLKEKNMVGIPLKVQSKVVGYNGEELLIAEQVNKYQQFGVGSETVMLLSETYEFMDDGTSVEQENGLFSFDRLKYDKTTIEYECNQYKYFPISIESSSDRTEVRYDQESRPILKVFLTQANTVAACDYRHSNRRSGKSEFKLLNAVSTKYRLFVLTTSTIAETVKLSINTTEMTSTREFVTKANFPEPQMFDLDLTSITGIEEISLTSSLDDLVYIALVPVGGEFEATSYNADGTIHCKFDHNGQTERYEYDAAGRVIRVFDRDGNVLKENSYNVVIQ